MVRSPHPRVSVPMQSDLVGVPASFRSYSSQMLDPARHLDRPIRKCLAASDPLEAIELATLKARKRHRDKQPRLTSGSSLVNVILQHGPVDLGWLAEELSMSKDVNLAAGSDGTTPLHAILEVSVGENDRQWLVPIVELLISRGVSVDARNDRGQTSLHVAVQNEVPGDCFRLLLERTTDVNAFDGNFMSPLQLMLAGQRVVDPACFRMLLRAGGDLDQLFGVQRCASVLPPLYRLCERSNDFKPLFDVVKEEIPDILSSNKDNILHHAAKHGSGIALEVLLGEYGEDTQVRKSLELLLLEAAGSARHSEAKVEHLVSRGVNIKTSSGQMLIHIAAQKGSLVLLETSLRHGQDPNQPDADGNAAIHYAAMAEGNDGSECIHLLVQYGADVNATNKHSKLPITVAVLTRHFNQVLALIKLGSNLPPPTIARDGTVAEIAVLADDRIIQASPNPLEATLELGDFFAKCADVQVSCENGYREMALAMEAKATQMLGRNEEWTKNMLSCETIFVAVSNGQKKFLAHEAIQTHLRRMWLSEPYCPGMTVLWYISLLLVCLLQLFALPFFLLFYILPVYRSRYSSHVNKFLRRTPPCVRHTASVLLYVGFMIILIYDSCTSNTLKKRSNLQAIDYIVLAYTVSFCLHQATVGGTKGFRAYVSDWSKVIDVFVVSSFVCYCAIRFIVISMEKQSFGQIELRSLRAASFVLAVATLLTCLQLLEYVKPYSGIGPIVISLQHIARDVAMFLFIVLTLATAFGLGISNVYAAGRYTDVYESAVKTCLNGNTTLHWNASAPTQTPVRLSVTPKLSEGDPASTFVSDCVAELLDSSAESERPVPAAVDGFGVTLGNLIWAVFGMVSAAEFDASSVLETTIGKMLLGLWVVAAVVLLVIMFGAIIMKRMQITQDSADVEWMFARAKAIRDLETSPTVPPPFNVLYSVALIVAYLCTCCFRKADTDDRDIEEADCTVESASTMIQNYKRQEAEEQDCVLAKKADIKSINQRLISLENTLSSWSSHRKFDSNDSGAMSMDLESVHQSRSQYTVDVHQSRSQYTVDAEAHSVPPVVSQQLLEMMKSLHQITGTIDRRMNGIERRMQSWVRTNSRDSFDDLF